MKNLFTQFSFLSLLILSLNNAAYTQWATDPNVNNPVCTTVNDQTYPLIISDGSGGAIIVWTDENGGNSDIYAQHIDANGINQWTADGVAISTAANDQEYPTIAGDGSGGAIIAWHDNRSGANNYDIYAQRIDASGIVQWAVDGVAVCTAADYQAIPGIVSDGSNGAFIIWQDRRTGVNYDIYAQRINAEGEAQWTANGAAICTAVSLQEDPRVIGDGIGGAICTWHDKRSGNYDIYAQLINSNGEVQWKANGVEICTVQWTQTFPAIVGDGNSGAIISWEDYRNSPSAIYAQQIDSGGVVRWMPDGVAISALAYGQRNSAMISDESDGAIITFQVNSSSNHYDIYAQHIDANGELQWTVNGAAICTANQNQQDPSIISDGTGGAIITWEDQRSGTNYDIYAQRINSGGSFQWTEDGVAISTARYDQIFPTLAGNGSGGAIMTWQDYRLSYPDSVDIYAQQINSEGILGVVTGNIGQQILARNSTLHQNYPNPFNVKTKISWQLLEPGYIELKVYDFSGREVKTLVDSYFTKGEYKIELDAKEMPSGVYFYQIRLNGLVETRKMVVLK